MEPASRLLHGLSELRELAIQARDGELGHVDDLFFDDRSWLVRYVVVDTGHWLPGRKVLVPRAVLGEPDWRAKRLEVALTREEIEESPGVESDPPLARDSRMRLYQSFVWSSTPWGGLVGQVPTGAANAAERALADAPDTHLRSAREIVGYRIVAKDGRIGHVEDFLLAIEHWTIHHLVVDTRNWLPGRKVVVPCRDVHAFVWRDQTAHLSLTKDEIKSAPEVSSADDAQVLERHLRVTR